MEYKELKLIISEVFNISPEDIDGKSRVKEVASARHLFRHFAFELISRSPSDIARNNSLQNGKTDHATILHSIKKTQDLIETDRDFFKWYQKCKNAIDSHTPVTDPRNKLHPFLVLIAMIEANHSLEDIKANTTPCKHSINYMAGYKVY